MNNIIIENPIRSKLNSLRKLKHEIDSFRKFSTSKIYEGDFVNFCIQETFNFEWFLVIGNW